MKNTRNLTWSELSLVQKEKIYLAINDGKDIEILTIPDTTDNWDGYRRWQKVDGDVKELIAKDFGVILRISGEDCSAIPQYRREGLQLTESFKLGWDQLYKAKYDEMREN